MSRQAFIGRLRLGLAGLPPQVINDIAADYETHFDEGVAAGRSEAEIAAALGDPDRLARELRAEASLKNWETHRNPSAAAGAIFAILGLGAIDLLILLPILMSIGGTLFGFSIAALACFAAGAVVFVVGPVMVHGLPVAAVMMAGLGIMAIATFVGSLTTLVTIGFVNALVWYGRLHMRVLKPALDPTGSAA